MNNTRLEILANPLAPKGELPFVKFAPGNGWSIQTATVKGCHLPDLADAVTDYNRAVTRKIEALNVAKVEPQTVSVMDLPGWGDAVRDEMNARYARNEAKAATKATATHERGAGKTRGPLGGILPLLAMAAVMGVFDDDDTAPVLDGPPSDDMRDLLESSSILHACPHGNAMLAVPRTLGDQWAAQLVEAIKADNVPAVRVMLTTAGLMK